MRLSVDGHDIGVSNPDKELFPGVTKRRFVGYHVDAGPRILPHITGRPISMKRYPDGIDGKRFFQKNAPKYFPSWIERVSVPKEGGTVDHVVVRRVADIAYMAGQASIELHASPARTPTLDRPDRLVFDLDPSVEDIGLVRAATEAVRDVLDDLPAFLMTSGSRGYHVVVPLRPRDDFGAVRAFGHAVAQAVVARDPDAFTLEFLKADRGRRVLIDQRTSWAQTSVVPYTVRARPGAPVATPLRWDELHEVAPDGVTIDTVLDRDDPWASIDDAATTLDRLPDVE